MVLTHVVRTVGLITAVCVTMAGADALRRTRVRAQEPQASVEELWVEPADLAQRNLRWGPGSAQDAPATRAEYTVQARDRSGYSDGYDVVDRHQREWDIKIGKEAQTEVAVSRILWALGYHQPVTYYVTDWKLDGEWPDEGTPARFRLQSDHTNDGEWEWHDNPFADSRPLHGLITINLLLNNWDLKGSNNRIYRTPAGRRYVVQDLGASLGKSRAFPFAIGTRNEIADFEGTTLIKRAKGSKVSFDYNGLYTDVLEPIAVGDVVWACELMSRLSDAQIDDAFEAAGYSPEIRARYVKKVRAKIQEGLALRETAKAPGE
jgi:hypothetical protein